MKPLKGDYFINRSSLQRFISSEMYCQGENERSRIISDNLAFVLHDKLTENERKAVRLYYIDGLNMPQISKEIGVHKCTISRQINSAKQKLAAVVTAKNRLACQSDAARKTLNEFFYPAGPHGVYHGDQRHADVGEYRQPQHIRQSENA